MSSDGTGKSLRPIGVTENEILRTDYAMITLASLFILTRLGFQATRRKSLELQDYFLYMAYVCYLALCALYIAVVPILLEIQDITTGKKPMPPNLLEIAGVTGRILWAAQMCFYACLWLVKLSLLCLYRKLLVGLPRIYNRIWWMLVIFCFLTLLGCVLLSLTACKDLPRYFRTSECYAAEEYRNVTIGLYLAYGMDVLTDILVMALPLRLVWNLQMPCRQKLAICMLFCTGLVCIAFATIRVVQLGFNAKGRAPSPEPKWLTFWGVLKTSVAVIIGCCPAFAALINTHRRTERGSSRGYIEQSGAQSSVKSSVGFKLKTMVSSKSRGVEECTFPARSHSSQEQLASPGGITVTTDLHQAESAAPVTKQSKLDQSLGEAAVASRF